MSVEYSSFSEQKQAKNAAVKKLNKSLKNFSGKQALFLLSGGSCLELLNELEDSSLNSNFTITVLDERYSADPNVNNFAQIANSEFYKKARSRGAKFIDTRVRDQETQSHLAKRFNGELTNWFKNNLRGTVIATVGIGPDGHVAGIMPYPENYQTFHRMFDNGSMNELVTSYDATGKNPYPDRVTSNMNLIRRIDTAIAFAVGENKRNALTRLRNGRGSLSDTPARILRKIRGKAYLFTDISIR